MTFSAGTFGGYEGALGSLHETTEPFTGQTWWTVDKTWRSHFSASDPPWAKDQERFDSEFYNGQALSAIEAAARLDPGLARRYGEQTRRLYTYYQLFWDWATGSALTHATGEGANIDGVQFAWEGMLATARLAQRAGDGVKRWDYALGHVSKDRLAAIDVETVGPIDAFVEEYGASVLELRSFWQCTNFLFYANRPLFELYRRYGLLERIRVIEYEIMPRLHPRWQDGNAVDPHGENGQERYGTAWTAAHLAARAALFGDDASALFQVYERTKGTPAAETWYRMQAPPIAGPLMLSLLEGGAPAAPLIA